MQYSLSQGDEKQTPLTEQEKKKKEKQGRKKN